MAVYPTLWNRLDDVSDVVRDNHKNKYTIVGLLRKRIKKEQTGVFLKAVFAYMYTNIYNILAQFTL